MKKISIISGTIAPLDRANVDTDAIIPKQFLKSVKRTGFGANLFDEWRYLDKGEIGMNNTKRPKNLGFVLNQKPYNQANILLTRENFGCGSSREHAPWALVDYGIEAVIASSFADIFYNNSMKNALLPVILSADEISQLFEKIQKNPDMSVFIDLRNQTVQIPHKTFNFPINDFQKHCLLNGLDDIGLTLQKSEKIKQFEEKYYQKFPWLD